jgi:hypothetical protein
MRSDFKNNTADENKRAAHRFPSPVYFVTDWM